MQMKRYTMEIGLRHRDVLKVRKETKEQNC